MPRPKGDHINVPSRTLKAQRYLESCGMRVSLRPGETLSQLTRDVWYAPVTFDRETGEPRGARWVSASDGGRLRSFKADPRTVQP